MNGQIFNLVHDLIVSMSGTFTLCVVAFFTTIVAGIIANTTYKAGVAINVYNAQKLQFEHEINKMAEQRKLIEQQVSNKVHNVKHLGENDKYNG